MKKVKIIVKKTLLLICSSFIYASFIAPAHASTVWMEDMTWMEIKDHIHSGYTTAIVPTGGTEQNGPQIVTGKHNIIMRYTAAEIAKKLGNALVVPVMAYVPEGRIDPPEGHMMFPGTLSISDQTFAAVLEDTARSLRQHGFKLICFIGDHGGSQDIQQQVADRLTSEWHSEGVRVLQVSDYYNEHNGQVAWTAFMNIDVPDPEVHAGLIDTSELEALDEKGVRDNMRGKRTERDYRTTGAMGDSSLSSSKLGHHYLQLKIDAAVKQIKHAAAEP